MQRGVSLPELNELLDLAAQGSRVAALGLGFGTISGGILWNVQHFSRSGRESCVQSLIPLHGGAGTGSAVASLDGGQVLDVAHADLIAVVDERSAGH